MPISPATDLPTDYFTKSRDDLTRHLTGTGHRVLDLGCGVGNVGAYLKRLGVATEVVGIDHDPRVASAAQRQLDDFRIVDLSVARLPNDIGTFSAIFLADIIEHLIDPWTLLRGLQQHLQADAQILASIPNVSAATVVGPLLLADEFTYRRSGILDQTHLRFFTRRSARQLFSDCGYVASVVGTNGIASRRGRGLQAIALCLGRFGVEQWIVKAHPVGQSD
jgi:2-polyprenyl-3-methyl-5-hydroxy-6-metoxy-1,4-benzoquinol methylase